MPTKSEQESESVSTIKNGDKKSLIRSAFKVIFAGAASTFLVSFFVKILDPIIVKSSAWLTVVGGVVAICDSIPCPHILPAKPTPPCETAQEYDDAKNAGKNELLAYLDRCGSYSASYLIDARNSLAQIEYLDVKTCIMGNCNATACLGKPNHLSVEQIDQLHSQAKEQENAASCHHQQGTAFTTPVPAVIPSVTSGPIDQTATQNDARHAALIAWSNQGLNAATKTRLPIAIVAPQSSDPSHYRDRPAAAELANILLKQQFNIVEKPEAALLVEVSDVDAHAIQSGHPFPGSYRTQWDGIASLNVRAIWIDGKKVLALPEAFSGTASSDNDTDAERAALGRAIVKAEDSLLALVAQK